MRKKTAGLLMALLVLALLVAACGGKDEPAGGSGDNTAVGAAGEEEVSLDGIKLRIARQDGPSGSLLYVADAKGYIKDEGLDYEISHPNRAFESLMAKEIDIAFGAPDTFSIYGENAGLTGLVAISSQPNDVKLVVASDINEPKDFQGRKIGIVPGTVSQYVMENAYFAQAGMMPGSDYETVATDPSQMVALLARGDISGFMLWEPHPASALETLSDKVKIALNSGVLGFPNTILVVVRDADLSDPVKKLAYQKLIQAFQKAETFIKENKQEAAEIIGKAVEQDPSRVMSAIETNKYELFMDDSVYQEIANYNDVLLKAGATKVKVDPQAVIDTGIIKSLGIIK